MAAPLSRVRRKEVRRSLEFVLSRVGLAHPARDTSRIRARVKRHTAGTWRSLLSDESLVLHTEAMWTPGSQHHSSRVSKNNAVPQARTQDGYQTLSRVMRAEHAESSDAKSRGAIRLSPSTLLTYPFQLPCHSMLRCLSKFLLCASPRALEALTKRSHSWLELASWGRC